MPRCGVTVAERQRQATESAWAGERAEREENTLNMSTTPSTDRGPSKKRCLMLKILHLAQAQLEG
jgi:hypothetical protein